MRSKPRSVKGRNKARTYRRLDRNWGLPKHFGGYKNPRVMASIANLSRRRQKKPSLPVALMKLVRSYL